MDRKVIQTAEQLGVTFKNKSWGGGKKIKEKNGEKKGESGKKKMKGNESEENKRKEKVKNEEENKGEK